MRTELYCASLEDLSRAEAIRAIHCVWLQLNAMGDRVEVNGTTYDNTTARERLEECLRVAGHLGFSELRS